MKHVCVRLSKLSSAVILCALFAVPGSAGQKQPETTPPVRHHATLILLHGNIYTGDPAKPRAEAVAVSGEAIFAVGSNAEIEALKESGTQVIDLAGRFVMPGFNDAHVHLASGGQAQLEVNLEGARTIEEVQQRIRARLAEVKPGEWIVGRGWDHTLWPDKKFPNRRQLDAVS
ncbi:MAG TPA: amidohydrolase family protein, partial [Candidatus Acidoferrales bacterium]